MARAAKHSLLVRLCGGGRCDSVRDAGSTHRTLDILCELSPQAKSVLQQTCLVLELTTGTVQPELNDSHRHHSSQGLGDVRDRGMSCTVEMGALPPEDETACGS